MKRLFAILALCALTASCSGPGPTSPSPAPGDNNPFKTPLPPTEGAIEPPAAPQTPQKGNWWTTSREDTATEVRWTVSIQDAARAFHVVAICHHNDSKDAGPNTDRPGRVPVRVEADPYYNMGQAAHITIVMKRSDLPCGSSQCDASLIFEDGAEQLVVGDTVRADKDCIPPMPTPVCIPETSFDSYTLVRVGNRVEATVSTRPEAVGARLYLTSYGIPTDYWPRVRVGEVSVVMSLGQNALSIPIASKEDWLGWQVKLACVPGPQKAGENFYSHANLLDGRSGLY